jgi:DNA-binding NarL/FixJ family response regulator
LSGAPRDAHHARVVARVLIVDDCAQFRVAVAELLTAHGLEVFGLAADGAEAIELTADACPDGILLDINLRGPDGFTVAAELAARCPSARIVLTSANVEGVANELLRASGASAFVAKDDLSGSDLTALFTPAGK